MHRPASRPRVAVFSQRGFPVYGAPIPDPQGIAQTLRAAGLDVRLVDADTLADPAAFGARTDAALILPYGNTFPADALANLRRFHQAGGSLVTTGIPFTHPAARLGATDWNPTPGWGAAVRVERGALVVAGDPDRWTGASSARFPVRPGQRVEATATVQGGPRPGTRPDTRPDKNDVLFIRFFDAAGAFVGQDGAGLTGPGKVVSQAVAPERAAQADISLQVQRADVRWRARSFAAMVGGAPVALPNADLSRRADVFSDLGHTDDAARFGPDGVGVGGFAGPGEGAPAPMTVATGDPMRLQGVVTQDPRPRPAPQWLDPKSLPDGVRVVPALGDAARPVAALVVHEKGSFRGAVDAWTFRACPGDRESYDTRQVLARATVAALARRGLLAASEAKAAWARLSALPRPAVYANLVLPEVPRRYATFQPKMPPPARRLVAADVRRLPPDDRLMLISLQGLVNRRQPRLYLIFDDDDRFWLDELRRQGVIDTVEPVDDPKALLARFRDAARGAVVCDPKVTASACVAVAHAGADDLLVARTAAVAARYGLSVKVDLRGRFADNGAALRHLTSALLPRLDPYLTCSLDPALFDRGGLDQLIAARGSVFWITGPAARDLPGADPAAELEAVRALLARLPLGAVVRGFWWNGDGVGLQEDAGVALASRFGKVTLVSDYATNLSVHSGIPATRLAQKPRPAPPPLDRGKVYVAFTMSDGDNLCTWRGTFRRYFDDPVRGTIPVGWGMGPALIDLAPDWMRWYYEQASPLDEFVCDVSGVAYMYPPSWGTALKDRGAALRAFYGRTREYMERADMRTIRLMDVGTRDIAAVGALLPGVEYLLPDYGHAGAERYRDLTYSLPGGQAVFRAVTSGSGPENLARQIRQRTAGVRPAFVNAFIWNWGSNLSDLKRTLEILGPEVVAVTPSQLHALYRAAR